MGFLATLRGRFAKRKAVGDPAQNGVTGASFRGAPQNGEARGLLNRYQGYNSAEFGQQPEVSHDELMDRYVVQPALRAPIDKIAKIICTMKPSIRLRDGYKEVPEQRKYLEALINHNDGKTDFYRVMFVTVVKIKVIGECAWELIYADQNTLVKQKNLVFKALFKEVVRQTQAELKRKDLSQSEIVNISTRVRRISDKVMSDRAKMPIGFKPIQGLVNPVVDKRGNFLDDSKAYVQIVDTGERQWFTKDEVLWMCGPNPIGGVHGLGPMETLRFIDDIDQKLQVYIDSLLNNRGELGGIVTVKNPGVGELDRMRLELDTRHAGPENAGKWHVVGVDGDGDIKVDKFGVEPMNIEQHEQAMRRQKLMWSVLNVPAGKVGFTEEVNRSNMEMEDKAFMEEEVLPTCKMVTGPFNVFIQKDLGFEAYELVFSQADLRTEQMKIDQYESRFKMGLVTLNELLEKEVGPDAKVEDGDCRIVCLKEGIILAFQKDKPARVITSSGSSIEVFGDIQPIAVTDPNSPVTRNQGPKAPGKNAGKTTKSQ